MNKNSLSNQKKRINPLFFSFSPDKHYSIIKPRIYNFFHLGNSIPSFQKNNINLIKKRNKEFSEDSKIRVIKSRSYQNFLNKANKKKVFYEAISTIDNDSKTIMQNTKNYSLQNIRLFSSKNNLTISNSTYNCFDTFSNEKSKQSTKQDNNDEKIIKCILLKLNLKQEFKKFIKDISINQFLHLEDYDLKHLNLNYQTRKIIVNFIYNFNEYRKKNNINTITEEVINQYFRKSKNLNKNISVKKVTPSSKYNLEVFVPVNNHNIKEKSKQQPIKVNKKCTHKFSIHNKIKIKGEKLIRNFKKINTEVDLFLRKQCDHNMSGLQSLKNTEYETSVNSPEHHVYYFSE